MSTVTAIGLAALLTAVLVLVMAYAMFGPRPAPTDYRNEYVRDENLTGFGRYIRPALRNFIPESPLRAILDGGRGSRIEELLVRSGNPYKLRATEYFALQLLLATAGFIAAIVLVALNLLPEMIPDLLLLVGIPVAGFFLPFSYHNTLRQNRARELRQQLPEALDLLVITMNAGKDFQPSLHDVVPRLPDGLLKVELGLVDKDLQSGKTISTSLNKFAHRASNPEAESFARAIAQTQESGSDVTETLINQAAMSRQSYEAAVDKKIARLSQTLVVPLILTILPAFLIVILAPNLSQMAKMV